MEIDNNKVVSALSAVMDPATGQDIISRRMISELHIKGNQVQFKLATADLPEAQKSSLNFACMEAIQAVYPAHPYGTQGTGGRQAKPFASCKKHHCCGFRKRRRR